jgi:hypothetical protein
MKKYLGIIALVAMIAVMSVGTTAIAAPKEQLNLTVYNSNLALVSMIKQMEFFSLTFHR